MLLAGCATTGNKNLTQYVVTTKKDYKIIFEDVATQRTQRVMTFDSTEMAYYHNIHVGDTIGCARPFLDTELVVNVKKANIREIIGVDFLRVYELQHQTAKRDSIIANMNKRQK